MCNFPHFFWDFDFHRRPKRLQSQRNLRENIMQRKFQTYDQVIEYLMNFTNYEKVVNFPYDATKLDLNRMHRLLRFLGDPQLATKSVHITGTKGKGSTALLLAAILAGNQSVGVFSSPHLVDMTERIVVDGQPISHEAMVESMNEMLAHLEEKRTARDTTGKEYVTPTFFEILTAIAWNYFRNSHVDVAVVEVGLGGRLDSTNVIAPSVCIITNVSLDHARQLGGTIESIAREKSGIVKPGVPVVTAALDPAAVSVIEQACEREGCPLFRMGRDFSVEPAPDGRFFIDFDGESHGPLCLNALGTHQRWNAACAMVAALLLKRADIVRIDLNQIARAMAEAALTGRVEIVHRKPLIVNDGAHNASSVRSTLETVRDAIGPESLTLVFAAGVDKYIDGMAEEIADLAGEVNLKRVVCTTTHDPRSCPPEKLATAFVCVGGEIETCENVEDVWSRAVAGDYGPAVCFTGSMYLAGRVEALRAASPRPETREE